MHQIAKLSAVIFAIVVSAGVTAAVLNHSGTSASDSEKTASVEQKSAPAAQVIRLEKRVEATAYANITRTRYVALDQDGKEVTVTPAIAQAAQQPAAQGGLIIFIDGNGNSVEPTAAQRNALLQSAGVQAKSEPVKVTTYPDGTLKAELGDEYMNYLYAYTNADGQLVTDCKQSDTAAVQAIDASQPNSQKEHTDHE